MHRKELAIFFSFFLDFYISKLTVTGTESTFSSVLTKNPAFCEYAALLYFSQYTHLPLEIRKVSSMQTFEGTISLWYVEAKILLDSYCMYMHTLHSFFYSIVLNIIYSPIPVYMYKYNIVFLIRKHDNPILSIITITTKNIFLLFPNNMFPHSTKILCLKYKQDM
jgi:hypothetical protein